MTATNEEIIEVAKAIFNLSIHYPSEGAELGITYTWETYDDIGKNHYLKVAKVALETVENMRNKKND